MSIARGVISELSRICKERCFTDPESLLLYGYDATGISRRPDAVVFPLNAEEVSDVLKLANSHAVPVTPRGRAQGSPGARSLSAAVW
ncbi:MAG: hypothetical protein M1491_00775 [Deltaproteobacteria bacterium]|nr:hypothetical protein [Deltaproteobacteria bacterium]